MTLLELRDALKAATAPSRDLDDHLDRLKNGGTLGPWHVHYTGSIDAAAKLVPPGSNWILAVHSDEGIAAAIAGPGDVEATEFGSTPALALCATAIEYHIATEGRT